MLHIQIPSALHLSAIHIGSPNVGAQEDLRRTVEDINLIGDILFVVITANVTEWEKMQN
ncbi:MAG: hypothetical protein ACJ749_08950 [Flavisolibacter sp.]